MSSASVPFWKADSGAGDTVSADFVTEAAGIVSSVVTPPCSLTGEIEVNAVRKNCREGIKLIKSAKISL